MEDLKVAIIGTNFMGKAHSNAYIKAGYYFDLPYKIKKQIACSRNQKSLATFGEKFHWEYTETDWRKIVERDDVDLIDISTPNNTHAPIAIAGAKKGKHLLCEKPMACTVSEAKEMYETAESAGVTHMMIFNYRFVPALALAKKMINAGKIGKIHHFNAVYYQDWLVDPAFPYLWRHDSSTSGSGAHGDMNAHIIDLARFFVGEFEAVNGVEKTFIKERNHADGGGKSIVTTDDATSFFAHFRNGALGSFQCTRFASGRKNYLRLEIFGSEGSLSFNLERLNELEYFSRKDESDIQGFRTILVTEDEQPYIKHWWPPGHTIGWEHTFIHQIAELSFCIAEQKQAIPSFYDGLKCQEVLDAATVSARSKKWIEINE